MNEHFEAVKGQGAFFNNDPINVSKVRDLQDSLLATGFPYRIFKESQDIMALFEKMVVRAQGIRRPGSAAIDLCYVAAGRLDGFWEEGLQPWDSAAGSLIVTEAGGKVSDFNGNPYTPYQDTIVAANPTIYKAMLKVLDS